MSVLGQFCSDRDRRHNLGHVSDGSWVFQGQNVRDELYFVSFTIWGMQQRELEPSFIGSYLLFWIWYQEHGWLNRNKSRKLLWDQVFSHGLEFQCHWPELYLQVVEYFTLLFRGCGHMTSSVVTYTWLLRSWQCMVIVYTWSLGIWHMTIRIKEFKCKE